MDIPFVRSFPIPIPLADVNDVATQHVIALEHIAHSKKQALTALFDWLQVNWDFSTRPAALRNPFSLSADGFVATLRAALPVRRRTLSAAAIAAIRAEHAATIAPMAARLAEAARREAELSALENRAYGLTPEEEALLWATAPPRMPIPPPNVPTAA